MNPRIYIANLPVTITEAQLQAAFAPFGTIANCFIAMDHATATPKGFAFVTYGTRQEADAAVAAMSGADLNGRALTVSIAREPEPVPVRRVAAPPPRRPSPGGRPGFGPRPTAPSGQLPR
ncbi:RNA recognition motif protein [Lacunisphaera limnophila]|uniref:RNA recognition motif protein n=1 Tax=Lacunisphaera limnophila TaxID=1838286 RepID=A0A1D8AUL9_9BACT|nr:RNA-binding protein [Lacunisphaera limnophila]AOS44589.1 RNA recognition motif protein [Lacunisphaera limnophila]